MAKIVPLFYSRGEKGVLKNVKFFTNMYLHGTKLGKIFGVSCQMVFGQVTNWKNNSVTGFQLFWIWILNFKVFYTSAFIEEIQSLTLDKVW